MHWIAPFKQFCWIHLKQLANWQANNEHTSLFWNLVLVEICKMHFLLEKVGSVRYALPPRMSVSRLKLCSTKHSTQECASAFLFHSQASCRNPIIITAPDMPMHVCWWTDSSSLVALCIQWLLSSYFNYYPAELIVSSYYTLYHCFKSNVMM